MTKPTPGGLDEHLRAFMAERRAPGMQVAVVRDGAIAFLGAYGLANVELRAPTTDKSVFSINSMTKAFTGVALMQLVERGLLDLDATISRYLDDLPQAWRGLTVRQLAALVSGLPEIMAYRGGGVGLIGDGDNDPDKALAAAAALPMQFAPGEGYRYVQTNFALLGRIIDRVAGMPFTQFIAENQLAAAGMVHTRFADDSEIIENRATTYSVTAVADDGLIAGPAPLQINFLNWPPILRTAAGLHSTAGDLARWIIALQGGALLKPSSLQAMLTPLKLNDGRLGHWGVGWIVAQIDGERIPAPAGALKAQIALYPDGLGVIVVTNLIGTFTAEQMQFMALSDETPLSLAALDGIAAFFRPAA